MEQINKQKELLEAVKEITLPLRLALQKDVEMKVLLRNLGWNLQAIANFPFTDFRAKLNAVDGLITGIETAIATPPETLADYLDMLDVIADLAGEIETIDDFLSTSLSITDPGFQAEFATLGRDLFNYLICRYLQQRYPVLHASLSLLGIIEPGEINAPTLIVPPAPGETWIRESYLKSEIKLHRLRDLISDPITYLKTIYSYPLSASGITNEMEAKIFSDKLFPRIAYFLHTMHFITAYGIEADDVALFSPPVVDVFSRSFSALSHPVTNVDVGFSALVGQTPGGLYGLILRLLGAWSFNVRKNEWFLTGGITGSIDAFAVDKNQVYLPSTFSGPEIDAHVSFSRVFDVPEKGNFGSTTGTRLEIADMVIGAFLQLSAGNQKKYGVNIGIGGIHLIVKGNDGDGFLNKILQNGLDSRFDVSIGWNNVNGLHFGGSGGLELNIPVHGKIGPVQLKDVKLSIRVESGEIILTVATTAICEMGPVVLTIENVGLSSNLSFPASGANLGIVQQALGFKLPGGVGISLSSEQVKGGGFLSLDTAKGIYKGGVHLEIIEKFGVTGVGIITTKNPDGTPGYSMFAMLSVTFRPGIPLGFGFTLSGLGAMLGINRDMNAKAIMEGVQKGTLRNVLFPEKVEERISSIITDLETFFPSVQNRYVLGMLARIDWGDPNRPQVVINLALVLNFPKPVRAAILGTVAVGLPDVNNPIVTLNVTFAGIIDFDKKYMMFDARIHDSKILTFNLSGDICMRLFWGDRKEFLLSSGGFHPAYQVPAFMEVPKMERMIMSMQSEIFSLSVKSYFALTSNTAQFGVNASIDFEVVVRIRGEIGFDTLFRFNPFHFQADAHGMVSLSIRKWDIMGVNLLLHVDGPNPWNAHGSVSYHLGPFKDTQSIKKTWGATAPAVIAPSVAVAPLVNAALGNDSNWKVEIPKRFQLKVGLKELPQGSNIILSQGYIQVSQLIAPLGLKIQIYGQQAVSDGGTYNISQMSIVSWDGLTLLHNLNAITRPVTDDFAPSQYLKMTDNEKLRAKSFESLKSGVKCTLDDEAEWIPGPAMLMKTMRYDKITIDSKLRRPTNGTLHNFLSSSFTNGGVVSNNTVVNKEAALNNRPGAYVTGKQERYKVKTVNTLGPVSTIGGITVPADFGSRAEARSFLSGIDQLAASGLVLMPTYP